MATPRVEPSALARGEAASRAASTADGRITNGALARDLGWFSIGLGLAEFLVPRSLGRMIGVGDGPGTRATLRALGLREIATGVGILNANAPRTELCGHVRPVTQWTSRSSVWRRRVRAHRTAAAARAARRGLTILTDAGWPVGVDETNDHAFAAVATTFAEYAHITLTRGDELV